MARAATTSDVFNAIAEPQRRDILLLLRAGERPVNELAQELGEVAPLQWTVSRLASYVVVMVTCMSAS